VFRNKIQTDNIIVRAVVNREKSLDIVDLYALDKKAAAYYAIYVIRSRVKYIENGSFGSELLDKNYYKLFVKGDRPDNIYKLDKEHVKYVIPGKEDEFLSSLSTTDIPNWKYGNMFEFYSEYVRLHSRSNTIERYLVNTFLPLVHHSLTENLFVLLSINVFKSRLCYSLSHIDPNIELKIFKKSSANTKLLMLYKSIFMARDIKYIKNPKYTDILSFMKINGQTEECMDLLLSSMRNSYELGNLVLEDFNFLTYENARYIYEHGYNYSTKLIGYTLTNVTGSKELEELYSKQEYGTYNIEAYQIYWNKFMNNRKMNEFEIMLRQNDMEKTLGIYWDNYKGKVDSIEMLFAPQVGYLRTRVGY
jgi:hypothetical protein